jgi:hypothetical protein
MIMNGEFGNMEDLGEEANEVYFIYDRITYYKERAEGRSRKLRGLPVSRLSLFNMKQIFQPLQYNVRF